MTRLAPLAAVLTTALALASCAAPTPTWQVMAIYTDPALPGALPRDAAGKANVAVRGDTLRGTTPCAQVEGTIARDDATVTLTTITIGEPEQCAGGSRHTHDQLVDLLSEGAVFSVRELSDTERLLTLAGTDAFDPPSIRLMAL